MTPLRILSDENLARLAAAGNSNAFAILYERHRDGLLRYCRSITRNSEHAADALQSTMVKALAALRSHSPKGAPRQLQAWLFRIAHNESISLIRQHRPSVDIDEVLDRGADPSPEVRGRLRELLDDLGRLSDRRRAALLMRELAGLSYEEIGTALGCSEAAVRQTVFEARSALTDLAEGRDSSCDTIRHKISDGDRRLLRARRVRAHLSSCTPCRDFDAAVSRQRSGIASLFPLLPAGGAAATLNAILAAAGGSGAGAVAAGGSAIGGTALAGAGLKSALAGVATLAAAGAVAVESNRIDLGDVVSGGTGQIASEARTGDAARVLAVGDAARSVAPSPTLAISESSQPQEGGYRAAASPSGSVAVSAVSGSTGTAPTPLTPVGGPEPIPGGSDPVVVSTHPDQPPSTTSPGAPGGAGTGSDTGAVIDDPGAATPTAPPTSTASSDDPATRLIQGVHELVNGALSMAASAMQGAQQLSGESSQWSSSWSGGSDWSGGSSYGD